jgi:hypothetical protein
VADDAETGKASRNEVRKVRAAFLNGIAVASIALGVVGPLTAFMLSSSKPLTAEQGWGLFIGGSFTVFLGFALHVRAVDYAEKVED